MTHTATAVHHHHRSGLRPGWTPLNIVLMVIGFAFFWPIGLAMLAWIIWGNELKRLGGDVAGNLRGLTGGSAATPFAQFGATGNVAFDEYRTRELKRLDEERRKIEAMRAEFDSFLKELRRARDQEEFEKFLAEYNKRREIDNETVV